MVLTFPLSLFVSSPAFCSTSVKLFGRKLAALAYDTSLKEGNLRYGLVRVQEHTESIAFLGSASIELNIVLGMLADVVEVLSNRIKWNCKLEVYSRYVKAARVHPRCSLSSPPPRAC